MSLLDHGPDAVQVYAEVTGVDGDNNPVRVPAGSPVTVYGRMQPVSAGENAADGRQVATVYRFVTRSFPPGSGTRVSWDGRDWDVVGEPQRSGGSTATQHVAVTLVARTPEPLT